MREIKFRGKDTTGIWRYGGIYGTVQPHIIHSIAGYETRAFTQVDPETVGQFTGELDTNNREIYEGDIIEIIYGVDPEYGEHIERHEVVFEHGAFKIGNDVMSVVCGYNPMRVVGNKFDNPELLKDGEKK